MDENDRRLARLVGVTPNEIARSLREAYDVAGMDNVAPTLRDKMARLRNEDYGPTIQERRKALEQQLADDDHPSFRF